MTMTMKLTPIGLTRNPQHCASTRGRLIEGPVASRFDNRQFVWILVDGFQLPRAYLADSWEPTK
jgi:hypothetical protein